MSRISANQATYVLGSHAEERGRLGSGRFRPWPAIARRRLRSGFRQPGPGRAGGGLWPGVGIDSAPAYLEHLRQQCRQRQLLQVMPQLGDLAQERDPASELDGALEAGSWDGAWCRWVAMFLPRLEPLLDRLAAALRPGGRLVLQEYIKWETFALHPKGDQLAKFADRCIQHWWAHGGDPNVAQRLPQLLEAHGFQLLHSSSLMACSPSDHPKAQWLIDFLTSYSAQLAAAGLWSAAEQAGLEAELAWAQQHASLWVTPAIVEMVWERL